MSKFKAIISIILLPIIVVVVIPALLISSSYYNTPAWEVPYPNRLFAILIPIGLITAGIWVLVETVRSFYMLGHGTLAAWELPEQLVIQGTYRYVRNPMILGVFALLLSEGILFGSEEVIWWLIFFVIINLFYVPLFEERRLLKRFGEPYQAYRKNVRRWIPRITPWESGDH